ncbi:acyl-CoA dehydrogenase [Rhodovibrio salinarum]|uniref:3-methylmercaptopropionyl-CoA dehydrogenase n=1 Tax=Rhodovibrio salinarum TaxID=1087 RepID=A0A934QFY2_9PROT|nr:acyl-CoA dehydrogenase [Rhodovibrio salinarum]MBK1695810.1 acyl-CoA dehydrogenase [Rhodovibrio salinarum]
MADYRAPLADLDFALRTSGGLEALHALPAFAEVDAELVDQIVEEAGNVAAEVWAPLNHSGDQEGVRLDNGLVRTAQGFQDAYRSYVDSGFNTLPFDPEWGGQGLPWTLALALMEVWHSANTSLALNPMLTIGAVELLQAHGTPEQQATYLPKLITGEWTGTMNLSEPQAGSDLGQISCKAERADDGSYRITGQKIYITWGEHDLSENIVHMVLARLPDAPHGTKGLSLFLVPKFLPDADGNPGQRNDVRCTGLEHKMGIHACPTCTMSYGDDGGAVGYLIGKEHGGLTGMFTMMNNARLAVGVQGIGIAERAYQDARAYAFERMQAHDIHGGHESVPIVRHPNIRRKLLTMRALTEGGRALALYAGNAMDRAKQAEDADERARMKTRVDLLVPVVKAWCTDHGVEVASTAVQILGGMGFIEEGGVAQHYRDARIAPIYEGTNGIQALDLMGRKVLRDEGAGLHALLADLRAGLSDLDDISDHDLTAIRRAVARGLDQLEAAGETLISLARDDIAQSAAVADPFLELTGTVVAGALLAQQAGVAAQQMAAQESAPDQHRAKLAIARFYADNLLPRADAAAAQVRQGAASTLALDEKLL